jgi:hypothetical protein
LVVSVDVVLPRFEIYCTYNILTSKVVDILFRSCQQSSVRSIVSDDEKRQKKHYVTLIPHIFCVLRVRTFRDCDGLARPQL